ncbi:MAG TPA: excalibur calcium-binding domain-containing protein [Dermatophilaceae bacterium]|nr:excalibur calcium-binding domain-containing protein [Dermatophilaceae bacterium]
MKIRRASALAIAVIAFSSLSGVGQAAQPESLPTVTKYSSCKKLNKVYEGGVAKSNSVRNMKTVNGKKVGAESQCRTKVSKALYTKNKGLDRDKDGIACER